MNPKPSWIDEQLAKHTNLGESCENCAHRFPYDECVACGEPWPCAASLTIERIAELHGALDRLATLAGGLVKHGGDDLWRGHGLERNALASAVRLAQKALGEVES